MFKWLDNPSPSRKKKLITKILKRKPPRSYQLSDSSKDVDYLSLLVKDFDSGTDLLVENLNRGYVTGFQRGDDGYTLPASCHLDYVTSANVTVLHKLGFITATFTGWKSIRYGLFSRYTERQYILRRVKAKVSSRFIKFSRERQKILQEVVDVLLSDDELSHDGVSMFGLLERIHGRNFYIRKDAPVYQRYFYKVIDSLKHDEALVENSGRIEMGPKALLILSDYEIAQRRHKDTRLQNWILIILTVALIFATLFGPILPRFLSAT